MPGHERDDRNDPDDPDPDTGELKSKTPRPVGASPVPLPVRPTPRPGIGVREPVFGQPKLLQGTVATPFPLPVHLSDLIGIPFPEPIGILEVMRVMNEAIEQIPASFSVPVEAVGSITAALGLEVGADKADVVGAAAEMEASEFFSQRGLPELLPVLVVPILERLFRILAPRAGVIGTPGRMDPVRPASTFRTSPHRFGEAFKTGQRKPEPVKQPQVQRFQPAPARGRGGGLHTPAFDPRRLIGKRGLNMRRRFSTLANPKVPELKGE